MQLFDRLVEAWPERTIVPSLAERWEIADDGLRYVFQLREGLTLVGRDAADRARRRVRHQARARPGSARLVGRDLLRARERPGLLPRPERPTPTAVGVRALDDRTVEFRLAAPAPYFLSVMNRPDGGPQPRHAIERRDAGRAGRRSSAAPFRIAERDGRHGSCSSVAPTTRTVSRAGQRRTRRVRARAGMEDALRLYARGERRHGRRSLHPAPRRPRRRGAGERRGHRPCRLDGVSRVRPRATRWMSNVAVPARTRPRGRSRRARRAAARRTCSSRRAGSSRPRCRGTRRTSSPASIPSSRAELLARVGCRAARCGSPASRTGPTSSS